MIGSEPQADVKLEGSGHTLAREGAKILYSEYRRSTVRTRLADDAATSAPTLFAHSYGSTTASYGRPGWQAGNDIRTITLAGSPGAPLQHASEFVRCGQRVRRHRHPEIRSRRWADKTGSLGRIFGRGLGMTRDECIRRHRVQPNSPRKWTNRESRTHNAYFRSWTAVRPAVQRIAGQLRAIASGHADRVDTERHARSIDDVGPVRNS